MKIIYIDDVTLIMGTARSVQVAKTCEGLMQEGVDITLVGLKGRGSLEEVREFYGVDAGFPIVRLPRFDVKGLYSYYYRAAFGAYVLAHSADIFYTRDLGVALLCSLLKRRFIYEMHSMPVRKQQFWMLEKVAKSPSLMAITAITQTLADALHDRFSPPREKIHVIPCAANPDPTVKNAPPLSRVEGRPYRVGYVGHLYPGKGGETIVTLAEARPEIEFHVVGDVPDPALAARAPKNLVLHGAQSHSNAMVLLRGFDAALAPYGSKTQAVDGKVISDWFSPLKVFEYMAHGKPIICSDLPVIREVLTDGENALMVEPTNIASWTAALDRLQAEPALAARLSVKAYHDIETRFSYRCRARTIVEIARAAVGVAA